MKRKPSDDFERSFHGLLWDALGRATPALFRILIVYLQNDPVRKGEFWQTVAADPEAKSRLISLCHHFAAMNRDGTLLPLNAAAPQLWRVGWGEDRGYLQGWLRHVDPKHYVFPPGSLSASEGPPRMQLRPLCKPAAVLVTLLPGRARKSELLRADRGSKSRNNRTLENLLTPGGDLARRELLLIHEDTLELTEAGRIEAKAQLAAGTNPLGKS